LINSSVSLCLIENENNDSNLQLHIFCDASVTSYAAAVYLRIENENKQIRLSLIMSKNKIMPVKLLSLPRLELQSALLGVRLVRYVESKLEINILECVYGTDSAVILLWIKAEPRNHHVFVANRLEEIAELTKCLEWR
jgi:hypothetical protein